MENLPLPDTEFLKILYELSSKDLASMAATNTHFRDLIRSPDFWDRKGQHMTKSVTLPLDSKTGFPIYGATNWKDYISTVENIEEIVKGLIRKLRVIDEPIYQLRPDGTLSQYDRFGRTPKILIFPKNARDKKIMIEKEQGYILVGDRDGYTEYLYEPIPEGTSEEIIKEIKEGNEEARIKLFSYLVSTPISKIKFEANGKTLFWTEFPF